MWCPGEPVRSSSHVQQTMHCTEDSLWRSLSMHRVLIAKNKMCSHGLSFLGSKGQITTTSFVWKGTYFSSKYTADFYIPKYILARGTSGLSLIVSYWGSHVCQPSSSVFFCIKSCHGILIPAVRKDFPVYHKFTKYLLSVLCPVWARLWRCSECLDTSSPSLL